MPVKGSTLVAAHRTMRANLDQTFNDDLILEHAARLPR
jgi:hypothetical protein